ncbi:MAG: RNA pseudouridine synthase [Hydrogenophaga sp.]|uniref:RNA pseudouridine synthase n=1 Tax=Hydrogenophaga sp. TaxID=1904254 RepID=UPI003D0D8EF7
MNQSERSEPQRLAKRLAAQVPCSRRDAELYIAGGFVRVDGAVVEEPMARVNDAQVVTLDAKARLEPLVPITLIWHKPAGQAVPEAEFLPDELAARWLAPGTRFKGDRSGVRPLKAHGHRLLPVSPLEPEASGLMVFTQNPGVRRKVTDGSSPLEHEWLVEVQNDPELDDAARREAVLQSLGKLLFFEGTSLPSARASWQSERRLRLAIKGTLPGQVDFLAERAGLKLAGVRRLRLGRIGLDGLPAGQWRYLAAQERF